MRLVKIRQTRRLHGASPQDCTYTHKLTLSHRGKYTCSQPNGHVNFPPRSVYRPHPAKPHNRAPCPCPIATVVTLFYAFKIIYASCCFHSWRAVSFLTGRPALQRAAAPRCTRLRFPRCRAVELPRVIVIAAVIMTIMLMTTIPYEWVRRV